MPESFSKFIIQLGYRIWFSLEISYEEIIICIDLWNLNRASDKDNYLVPPMEQILQLVSDFELFSLLDGFSGYN
jgi:hypothetical protein